MMNSVFYSVMLVVVLDVKCVKFVFSNLVSVGVMSWMNGISCDYRVSCVGCVWIFLISVLICVGCILFSGVRWCSRVSMLFFGYRLLSV